MSEENLSVFRKTVLVIGSIFVAFVLTVVIKMALEIISIAFNNPEFTKLLISITPIFVFILPFLIYPSLSKILLSGQRERAKAKTQDAQQISPEQRKINELQTLISTQKVETSRLQQKYNTANKVIADLKTKNEELMNQDNSDIRFNRVKRAFAQRYHPDNLHSNGIEKLVKEEIFKEFWEDISRIEKDD